MFINADTKRLILSFIVILTGTAMTEVARADCNTDASAERRICSIEGYTFISRFGDHGYSKSAANLATGPNNHDVLIHTIRDGRLHMIAELSFFDRANADVSKNVYKPNEDFYRINVPMETFAGTYEQLQRGKLEIVFKNRLSTGITATLISDVTPVAD